jgi:hypothetical protein
MALFPAGDNYPIDIYPVKNPLDGTEMIEIANQGTKKLFTRTPDLAAYIVGTQSVINTLSTPPVSPADQDTYIVGATPTGAWAGQTNNIAIWSGYYRIWFFLVPRTGWFVYITGTSYLVVWSGAAWTSAVSYSTGIRGTFTLTAGATSTVVTNANCLSTSVVVPSALTADAANDMALMWFTPANGSFTVHHANNARVDRTFGYAII